MASDAGERPAGLAVWAELSELVDRVRILLNRDLQAAASLTLAENLVLCQVAMAPAGRLRMADIASTLTIAKSAVTKTVDRSYLGTDIRTIAADQPTMNLESFSMDTDESEYHRVVRHETGHTLGFPHEHTRAEIVNRIDRDKAIAFSGDHPTTGRPKW